MIEVDWKEVAQQALREKEVAVQNALVALYSMLGGDRTKPMPSRAAALGAVVTLVTSRLADVDNRAYDLEKENTQLRKRVQELEETLAERSKRMKTLDDSWMGLFDSLMTIADLLKMENQAGIAEGIACNMGNGDPMVERLREVLADHQRQVVAYQERIAMADAADEQRLTVWGKLEKSWQGLVYNLHTMSELLDMGNKTELMRGLVAYSDTGDAVVERLREVMSEWNEVNDVLPDWLADDKDPEDPKVVLHKARNLVKFYEGQSQWRHAISKYMFADCGTGDDPEIIKHTLDYMIEKRKNLEAEVQRLRGLWEGASALGLSEEAQKCLMAVNEEVRGAYQESMDKLQEDLAFWKKEIILVLEDTQKIVTKHCAEVPNCHRDCGYNTKYARDCERELIWAAINDDIEEIIYQYKKRFDAEAEGNQEAPEEIQQESAEPGDGDQG